MHVLFYFLQNPIPPRSGAHHRALQLISGLIKRGDRVVFASSNAHTDTPWTEASVSELKSLGCQAVHLYHSSFYETFSRRVQSLAWQFGGEDAAFQSTILVPRGLKYWFKRLVDAEKPDAIVVSYCWFANLVTEAPATFKVVDHQGLFSINNSMEDWIGKELRRFRNGQPFSDHLFDETLADHIRPAILRGELALYDAFDQIVTLSPRENELLMAALPNKRYVQIPLTVQPKQTLKQDYSGTPLSTVGPNQFNQLGIEYFGQRVLPIIKRLVGEFELNVTGDVTRYCTRYDGMKYLGFVPDLEKLFIAAPFSICTTAFGTGQQVKIIEALSKGLPVVLPRSAAIGTIVVDGENGFIVDTANEFAERVAELWKDKQLCRQMGENAWRTAVSEYEKFLDLSNIWPDN